MNWLQTIAVVLHVLLAIGIIGLVLLQRGKGADAGAGFGAGASGTVFGARGSGSFLSRTTAILATLFFLTSLGLSFLFSRGGDAPSSVVDQVPVVPALPAAPANGSNLPAIAPQAVPAPTPDPAPDPAAVPTGAATSEPAPAPQP